MSEWRNIDDDPPLGEDKIRIKLADGREFDVLVLDPFGGDCWHRESDTWFDYTEVTHWQTREEEK